MRRTHHRDDARGPVVPSRRTPLVPADPRSYAADVSAATVLYLVCAACAVASIVLAVLGVVWLATDRRVRRVRVPARLVTRAPSGAGETVDVEYPAPDGRPLRARLVVADAPAPGTPPWFDGTVWVDPANPLDVRTHPQARRRRAVVALVAAGALFVATAGTGLVAMIVGLQDAMSP